MSKTRTNVVIGRGSSQPLVCFVGEAPGYNEDRKGMPFVGQAGEVLIAEIQRIGLSYNDYYIANACKCRPITDDLKNRKPSVAEIENCSSFLQRQVCLLRPRIIVLLGDSAKTAYSIAMKAVIFNGQVMNFIHPAHVLYRHKMYLVLKVQFDNLRDEVVRINDRRKINGLY
jgi:DNA polymerase